MEQYALRTVRRTAFQLLILAVFACSMFLPNTYGQTTNSHNISTTVSSSMSAQQSAQPQPGNMLPAGATVNVRMVDAVDSTHPVPGGRYRATVSQPLEVNGVTIPQGSAAAVVLVQAEGARVAQLASMTINGQVDAVSSGSVVVTSTPQSAASSAAGQVSSMLGRFGKKNSVPAGLTAVATGERVILPPGTGLRFVLSGTVSSSSVSLPPTASALPPATSSPSVAATSDGELHAVAQAGHAPAGSSGGHSSASNPSGAEQHGRPGAVAMFCHAVTTQTTPPTAYVSPVIAWGPTADPTHDSTEAWSQYLTKTYPGVRFDSQVQCVGPSTQGIEQDRADYISQKNKVRNKFKMVETDWRP